MPNGLNVLSSANVTRRCRITYHVNDGQFVDFIFGDVPHTFDLGLEVDALREFVKLGGEAVREMESLAVQETQARQNNNTDPATAEAGELATAGERS
jgi:hypothetical protein